MGETRGLVSYVIRSGVSALQRKWVLLLLGALLLVHLRRGQYQLETEIAIDNSNSQQKINTAHLGRRIAWGLHEDTAPLINAQLPAPRNNMSLTIVQAVVRSNKETYRLKNHQDEFLQVLTVIQENNPPVRHDIWQIMVRNVTYIQSVECRFTRPGSTFTTQGSIKVPWQWDVEPNNGTSGSALLLHCPVESDWLTAAASSTAGYSSKIKSYLQSSSQSPEFRADIALRLSDTDQVFKLPTVRMQGYSPPPVAEIGFCVAPLYGTWYDAQLTDWIEHHALLKVTRFFFYARNFAFSRVINRYQEESDSYLFFRPAPPISPQTYGTKNLEASGYYADQVLYSLDCMMRSIYLAPSRWLGFLDLDEYVLPHPMPNSTTERESLLGNFLNSRESDVPSVSLGRTHHATNNHLKRDYAIDQESLSRIDSLNVIRPPQRTDWPGNYKHFHRVDAVEGTSVHAPAELYPGFVYRPPLINGPLTIVHFGSTPFSDGPYARYDKDGSVQNFMTALNNRKKRVLHNLRHHPL